MKKKIIAIIICFALIIPLLGGIAYATNLIPIGNWSLSNTYQIEYGTGSKTEYSLNGFIQLYKKSSPEYKKIDLAYQLNDLYLAQLDMQLSIQDDSINMYRQLLRQNEDQTEVYRNTMAALEEGSDEWNIVKSNLDECLLNISTYRLYLEDAIIQKAEVFTQRENYQFINRNIELLRKQEQTYQTGSFMEKCIYLMILQENYHLASASVDYNLTLYQIQRASLEQGRATQIDVDYQQSSLLIAHNLKDSILSRYNSIFKDVLRRADISDNQSTRIRVSINDIRQQSLIDFETLKSSFISNDTKEKQLTENISIIEEKINILKQVYDESSDILILENKKKEIALMEHDSWLLDRLVLLNNIYSEYETKYKAVNYQEIKASAQYKKHNALLNKFNLGLISKIELQEARLQLMQSELDAWTAFYEYVQAKNTVELAMFGRV